MPYYEEVWGYRLPVPDYGPIEPAEVNCPRCGATILRRDVKVCEWCGLEAGCSDCMESTIDGYVCSDECAEALRRSEDRRDEERNQKGDENGR